MNTTPNKIIEPRKSYSFEATPEDEETQDELNRRLRKPGECGQSEIANGREAGELNMPIAVTRNDDLIDPQEVVAKIQRTARNPLQVRAATASLADMLRDAPVEVGFDPEKWQQQWSAVEAELKTITRANELAEGRGG